VEFGTVIQHTSMHACMQASQAGGVSLRALEGMLGGDAGAAQHLQPFLGQVLAASQLQAQAGVHDGFPALHLQQQPGQLQPQEPPPQPGPG
jgi:hypothetical protein